MAPRYSSDAAGVIRRGPPTAPARSILLEGRNGNRRPARFPIIGTRSRCRVFARRDDFFLCSAAILAYENESRSPKISAYCFFRPYRAFPFFQFCHPRLAPWAAVFGRFAAGTCKRNLAQIFAFPCVLFLEIWIVSARYGLVLCESHLRPAISHLSQG